jgi:hypothetical protein
MQMSKLPNNSESFQESINVERIEFI